MADAPHEGRRLAAHRSCPRPSRQPNHTYCLVCDTKAPGCAARIFLHPCRRHPSGAWVPARQGLCMSVKEIRDCDTYDARARAVFGMRVQFFGPNRPVASV